MKISVIIPTYNEEKSIGDCLDSLGKQSYKDIEVIVVDDGSVDKTLEVLSKLKDKQSLPLRGKSEKLKVFEQKHKGPGEARNLGVRHAKGKILVFVDADMTFAPDFIQKLVDPLIRGKAKGTSSREEIVSNWENVWARCWNINEGWEERKRHPKNYPNKQKVFRAILKSEFDKVEGFDKGGYYTDDWSLAEKLGYEAILAPGAVFYHENPNTLVEVFAQAKWTAKRPYKLGIVGNLVALTRSSLPISIAVGFLKSTIYKIPQFFVFKIVYDLGAFIGIIEYTFSGKGAK